MGGKCPHRRVKKRRYSHKTFHLPKFLVKDILFIVFFSYFLLVFLNLTANYQTFCVRYFANVAVRDEHFKTKRHKKRYVFGLIWLLF
ncbi:hypothetical protein Hdeb2414_s0007g00234971 [Helianthus debilis subsp. tardiflorus]